MKTIYCLILLFFIKYSLFSQNTYTIEFEGDQIFYKVFETQKPDNINILIINGGPGLNSNGFDSLAKELSESNTVITYDQRGTGKSLVNSVNAQTMTLDLMISDIETLRKYLKLDNWIVLGHSFGGMLASYYASNFPDKVSALILSSSGGLDINSISKIDIDSNLTESQRDSLAYWTKEINSGDTTYYAKFQRGKHLAPAYLQNSSYIKTIAHRLTQVDFKINQLVFQNMNAINFNCKNQLKSFSKPVLIIQGRQDIIPLEISEDAHDVFPNSRLVVIENSGHYGWLDQPKKFFTSINDFLNIIHE